MTFAVITLIVTTFIWMVICAWCGYGLRFARLLAVLVAGLALKMFWLLIVLKVTPLNVNVVTELFATMLYGLAAFGCGYLVGRLVRLFRASSSNSQGV